MTHAESPHGTNSAMDLSSSNDHSLRVLGRQVAEPLSCCARIMDAFVVSGRVSNSSMALDGFSYFDSRGHTENRAAIDVSTRSESEVTLFGRCERGGDVQRHVTSQPMASPKFSTVTLVCENRSPNCSAMAQNVIV
jgi:hypothetical protein